jgi:hypothetical protein
MFIDEARSTLGIAARTPRPRLDQHLDAAGHGHAEKAETQEPAQLTHPRIALTAGSRRRTDREPDFVASRCAVDPLEDEFEVEAELELADDDERWLVRPQRDQIAAADFTFDVESEAFEKAFHRAVERRFPNAGYRLWGWLMQHEWIPA